MAYFGITGATRTTFTLAIEVLLGPLPLHLQLDTEVKAGIETRL
jgi:hypothetical protein